jgi:hypothetical protein
MIDSGGGIRPNSDSTAPSGLRTPINGSLSANIDSGAGNMSLTPFSFNSSGLAFAASISLQAIGDGMGGPGTLLLGNMSFNWFGNTGIPVSIVWDAQGLFEAINSGSLGVGSVITGGDIPASDNATFGSVSMPLGASPLATTTWNTTDIGLVALGTNPSGTLPLSDDGIAGSPMATSPFPAFNMNYDFTSLQVTSIVSTVPVPAAVWLFGSGLLGLIGVAKRRNC